MEGLKTGDVVKLKRNAVSYNGRIISGKLKKGGWTVKRIKGDRAWLEFNPVVATDKAALTVNVKNIRKKLKGGV